MTASSSINTTPDVLNYLIETFYQDPDTESDSEDDNPWVVFFQVSNTSNCLLT